MPTGCPGQSMRRWMTPVRTGLRPWWQCLTEERLNTRANKRSNGSSSYKASKNDLIQRRRIKTKATRSQELEIGARGKKSRVLSGMRPTGRLHIGHYFGALQNWVRLQNDPAYECFYFIADWHALTSDYADTYPLA